MSLYRRFRSIDRGLARTSMSVATSDSAHLEIPLHRASRCLNPVTYICERQTRPIEPDHFVNHIFRWGTVTHSDPRPLKVFRDRVPRDSELIGQLVDRRTFAIARHEPLRLIVIEYSLPLANHVGFRAVLGVEGRNHVRFRPPRFPIRQR
jgi:hypothetical protein